MPADLPHANAPEWELRLALGFVLVQAMKESAPIEAASFRMDCRIRSARGRQRLIFPGLADATFLGLCSQPLMAPANNGFVEVCSFGPFSEERILNVRSA